MSLKGTAMTGKVLRGKITSIHQIEEVEALYAEAEDMLAKAKSVDAEYNAVVAKCDETIDKIEQKGEEVIATIPQDYTALVAQCDRNTAKIDKNDKRITNLEQGFASPFETDNTVAYRKDVPANALPFAEVSMVGGMTRKCENLIPFPYGFGNTTQAGVTVTINSDGGVTYNGTATAQINPYFVSNLLLHKGTYTLSGSPKGSSWDTQILIVQKKSDASTIARDYGNGAKFTLDSDTAVKICLIVAKGATCSNLTIYPMLNEGSTVLPYEPYFEGLRSAPVTEVESVGVNLLPYPYAHTTKTQNGITFTDNGDGSITVNGTATAQTLFYFAQSLDLLTTNKTYYMSGSPSGGSDSTWRIEVACGGNYSKDHGGGTYFEAKSNTFSVYMVIANGTTVNKTFYPMLNKGETALPYSPYVKNILPIPTEVQALDGYGDGVNESVYNYIDWEKKQFVKRVGKVDLSSLEWSYSTYWVTPDLNKTVLIDYNNPPLLAENYETHAWTGRAEGHITMNSTGYIVIPSSDSTIRPTGLLYYELATPIITDISALLPDDNFIGVEGGGTVTMVNEHQYSVPSSITYQVKGDA